MVVLSNTEEEEEELLTSLSPSKYCCLGHVIITGTEQANRLVSTADITAGLQLGRAEMLRGLRNFLCKDRPEHHSTDHLKEGEVDF